MLEGAPAIQPTEEEGSSAYRSFVLRLWWERAGDELKLRIVVQDTQTGEWRGLASIGDLVNLLVRVIHEQ